MWYKYSLLNCIPQSLCMFYEQLVDPLSCNSVQILPDDVYGRIQIRSEDRKGHTIPVYPHDLTKWVIL